MIDRCASFGGDFQASPARARKASGVGILIDLYFLDGGRGDAGAVGFDAVDEEGDAASGDGIVGEKAGEQGDVVLVENGDMIEGVAGDVVGIEIFGGIGGGLGLESSALTLTTSLTEEMAKLMRREASDLVPTERSRK